jgi:hypothetical protein
MYVMVNTYMRERVAVCIECGQSSPVSEEPSLACLLFYGYCDMLVTRLNTGR